MERVLTDEELEQAFIDDTWYNPGAIEQVTSLSRADVLRAINRHEIVPDGFFETIGQSLKGEAIKFWLRHRRDALGKRDAPAGQ